MYRQSMVTPQWSISTVVFTLCALCFSGLNGETKTMKTLFDFTDGQPAKAWTANNDGVMGGLSEGSAVLTGEGMRFGGDLSLENNGGFASVYVVTDLDLSAYDGVHLKVFGDGRSYQLRFESDARFQGWRAVTFSYEFPTVQGEWIEVFVPFSELRQSWRGRTLTGYEFNTADIRRVALMLADKNPGKFQLTVAWIAADIAQSK